MSEGKNNSTGRTRFRLLNEPPNSIDLKSKKSGKSNKKSEETVIKNSTSFHDEMEILNDNLKIIDLTNDDDDDLTQQNSQTPEIIDLVSPPCWLDQNSIRSSCKNVEEIDLTNDPDILNIIGLGSEISQQNKDFLQQNLENDVIDLTSPLINQNSKKSRLNNYDEIDLTNDTESWSMHSEDSKDNHFFPKDFNSNYSLKGITKFDFSLIANNNRHGSIEISTEKIIQEIKFSKFQNRSGNLVFTALEE